MRPQSGAECDRRALREPRARNIDAGERLTLTAFISWSAAFSARRILAGHEDAEELEDGLVQSAMYSYTALYK